MASASNKRHVSSGAVVWKLEGGVRKFLVMYRRSTKSWHLPKGTQELGETLEATALREVQEETGLEVALDRYLGMLNSTIHRGRESMPKETHYFLAHPTGGIAGSHDAEHDEIHFLAFGAALRHLEDFSPHEKEGRIFKMAERFSA